MAITAVRGAVASSLRTRVFVLIVAVFVAVSIPAYVAFDWIIGNTTMTLGTLFAEKQILFDRYRGLETLFREASLAETLARAPAIVAWAQEEDDPDIRARGLAELEHYRKAFADGSVFFVIDKSGNYYFNDRDGTYTGNELRYRVDRANPRDGWYFMTIAREPTCQLNVDHDDNINVTKVWVNCVVRVEGKVLGVVGTGIDLTAFIRDVVAIPQKGVQSLFVDDSGAIQAHRDPEMVEFHSLTNDTKAKKTAFLLLDDEADRQVLAAMMADVKSGRVPVRSAFVRIGGHEMLVGVGYLNEIGWFNVTLMDIDEIIDRRLFLPIGALLAAMLAVAAVLVTLLFKRQVLDRLARLEAAVQRLRNGEPPAVAADPGRDEIGRLSESFVAMATAVIDQKKTLERMVEERTEQLERLANLDPLTDVLNRRGFIQAVEAERSWAGRNGTDLGLLMIDLDSLKVVNDSKGHSAGDRVLTEVARRITRSMRRQDICGRWGGDEFVVLVSECDEFAVSRFADRVLATIRRTPIELDDGSKVEMTASVGACMVDVGNRVEASAAKADAALYDAKAGGRDRLVMYDPARHAPRPRIVGTT
jgi:diguanylate cyclase (GGDEF)-like protein